MPVVSQPAARGEKTRVLFLDDAESMVELVKVYLTRRGYTISGFTNPADAIAALRENPRGFDLVVSDCNLPGASGLHFVQSVLKIRPDLRVALTSGYIDDALLKSASAAGVMNVIHKVDGMDVFCESIDRIMAEP